MYRPMHVSNFVAMTCVSPLIRIVTTFSFTVTQLACFPIPQCNLQHGALPCKLVGQQHHFDNPIAIVFECHNPFDYYEL